MCYTTATSPRAHVLFLRILYFYYYYRRRNTEKTKERETENGPREELLYI